MLSLHRTIREIDPTEWNHLSGGNAFATHGWLLTVESCRRTEAQPLYFTLREEGALVAASVCYVATAADGGESLDDMLFGRLAHSAGALGLSFLPAVVCGPALGYGWHIGVDAELSHADQDRARREVLDAIEAAARERRLQVHFVQLLDDERELQDLLGERGYLRCRNAPVAALDVKWNSFEDYLAALPRRRRREFRRQVRRNREAGSEIELAGVSPEDEGRLLELVDINARQHNAYPFAFGPGFFSELKVNLKEQAWIIRARCSGAVTGVCGVLVQDDAAYPFLIGVDHEATDDYTYFQIGYNAVIARAIELGIGRIFYGRGMYEIKLRRGCRLTESWIYSQAVGPRRLVSAPWFRLASFWNRYKLPPRVRRALQGREGKFHLVEAPWQTQ